MKASDLRAHRLTCRKHNRIARTPAVDPSPSARLDRIAAKADGLAYHLEAIQKRAEARVAADLAQAAREATRPA